MEWLSGLWAWFKSLYDRLIAIIDRISDFAQWLIDFVVVIFEVLGDLLLGFALDLLDALMRAALSLLNAISIPFNPATYYSMIPPEVANLLGYIGFPQAMSMVVTALIIRFGLQLIPFVRLGS